MFSALIRWILSRTSDTGRPTIDMDIKDVDNLQYYYRYDRYIQLVGFRGVYSNHNITADKSVSIVTKNETN